MSQEQIPVAAALIDDSLLFTLAELAKACNATGARIAVLVQEGVLTPIGAAPEDWRFPGSLLSRVRAALRLAHDFDLDAATTALVLDLIEENERLRAQLRRAGLASGG
jgi:chaperone modulatory protein CbpM